jgi:hypothetical protein
VFNKYNFIINKIGVLNKMNTLTIKVKHPEYGDEVKIMADSIYYAHESCSQAIRL